MTSAPQSIRPKGDLVRQLRGWHNIGADIIGTSDICQDAANEIVALRAKVDDLRNDYLRRHKDATDRWMALKLAELALCKASLTDAERISDALIAIRAVSSVNSQHQSTLGE